MENKKNTKLSLMIEDVTTTWESDSEDLTFNDILEGFLGCMFGQGYVPGTEMESFKRYISGMEPLYKDRDYE